MNTVDTLDFRDSNVDTLARERL